MKKKLLVYITALLLVICMGACTVARGGRPAKVNAINEAIIPVTYPESIDSEQEFEEWLERRENTDLDPEFVTSINDFAYSTGALVLADSDKANVNYSPTSLYYALAVAALGAEGETQDELLTLLGADSVDELSEQCKNLFVLSYAAETTGAMTMANSLWVDDSLSINEKFAQNAAENFFASSHYGDFSDPELAKAMSDWVSQNTNGLLKPEFKLSDDEVFSIINALYFAAEWTDRFNKDMNTTDNFYLEDGSTSQAEYMHTVMQAGFATGENFTRANLGLKKGSMFFVLPHEGTSVKELLADEAAFVEACSGGQENYGKVTWQVPKFDFKSELKLKDAVKNLGAGTMFTDKADFSGISDSPLFVSDIQQGTKIAIDEKGVEAAAYTEILYCGAALVEDEAYMILNRPFIFGINDECGNIVFMGICGDPAEK